LVNLYIARDFQEFYDQLKVVADGNKRSFAGEVGKAVKEYIQKLNDNAEVIDKDAFTKLLKSADKEELLELSTFICEMNNKIIEKCRK